jgi:hypothetical protein
MFTALGERSAQVKIRVEICEEVNEIDVSDAVATAVERIEREYEFGMIVLYAKQRLKLTPDNLLVCE